MNVEIETDTHNGVGPLAEMYGHGPVTVIREKQEHPQRTAAARTRVFICLDCGFTAADNRLFAHEACNRENNDINQTWREYLNEEDSGGHNLPVPDDDAEWPIE